MCAERFDVHHCAATAHRNAFSFAASSLRVLRIAGRAQDLHTAEVVWRFSDRLIHL
jgi:hypothetical protein